MTVLTPKRPDETVLYTFDLRRELQDDVVKTYTLEVTSGTVTLSNETNLGIGVTALIAGGADAETAALTLTVNTVGEQVIEKNYTLLIADGVTAVVPSTSTKRYILIQHFAAMGLSPYEFDPTPEEYRLALDNLDMMMAEWAVSSLDLGYAFPATLGGGDLDDVSGIPDFAVNATALSLAQRVAPFIGKSLSREAQRALAMAMVALRTKIAVIPDRALPFLTIRGAGGKPWSDWWPFQGQYSGGAPFQQSGP